MSGALLAAVWVTVFVPRTSRAVPYEIFVDVETEEDLYELLVAGQISNASFDALLLLHQTKVELENADRERLYLLPNLAYADVDRIMAYRSDVVVIQSLKELVSAGVLGETLARSLRAFVSLPQTKAPGTGVHGFARLQAAWSGRYDRLPPPFAIQARMRARRGLDAGIMGTLTRNQVRRVRWDSIRDALSVEPEKVRFEIPKAYLAWRGNGWEVVGGTYRIGFGQRLTFDVTDQVTPSGASGDYELRRVRELGLRCRRAPGELTVSPCGTEPVARVTPDFRWTNRLTGVAVGWKRVTAREDWIRAHLWSSYQVHRVAQAELVNAAQCRDPRRDDDAQCRAPFVFVRGDRPSAPSSTLTFASLPMVVAEGLGGARVSYSWHERAHLGFTGYGSVPQWRVRGVELGFQESAKRPFGGPFGAVGIDAAWGFGRQDFFAELARSFDRQVGGRGGYGAVLRSVTALPAGEVDVSVRYYGSRYANPYARPVAAADELDGLRARDEAGFRVRAAIEAARGIGVRWIADAWRTLSTRGLRALLFVRADFQIGAMLALSVWAEYRNAENRARLASQLTYAGSSRWKLSCQLQHAWLEEQTRGSKLRQDLTALASLIARPAHLLRLRFRARYDFQDLQNNHRLPQTFWAFLEAAVGVRTRDTLRARYDFRVFLDRRESTRARAPNPEHWLWLEYVFRY